METLSHNSRIISKDTFQQPPLITIRIIPVIVLQASLSNQTNEIKNMMAGLFQMNSASTSGSGSLPSNTVANSKGKLKAITTRSGRVLDGPTVPTPTILFNLEEDKRVEETLIDPNLAEYTIKLHINTTLADALILMPKYQKMLKALLSNKEKLQELANIPLNENCSAVILKKFPEKLKDLGKFLIPCGFSDLKCKALADLVLAADSNTFLRFQDNIQGYVSAAAINYNQGSGPLPSNPIANPKDELKSITTRSGLVLDGPFVPMPPPFINPKEDERAEETLTDPELAEDPRHHHILYPLRMNQEKQQEIDEIQIHKFWQMFKQLHINITLADALILILKYQNMLKALLSIKEKLLELPNTPLNENCLAVILKKLPERLGDPGKFLILCGFSELKCKALANLGTSINLMLLSVWKKLGLPELISTRMAFELANWAIYTLAGIARDVFVLVGKFTFPANFVIVDYESDPRVLLILRRPFLRIAHALNDIHGEEMILHDDSILKDSVDECNLADPNNDLVDFIPEMFTDEHTLDYSSPPLHDDVDDDLVELEYDNGDVYDDPFDSKEDKIKESKLLIAELNPPRSSNLLPYFLESDSVLYKDFSEVDALPSTNNEDKVFNLYILIHKNLFEVTIRVTQDKNVNKISVSNASLILEDFNSPLYELPFHKEVLGSETLLSFSSENEEKVFNPGILTSKGVYTSLLSKSSHRGPKAFKFIKIFESPMEIFPCSYGKDIRILDVPCLHFYPPMNNSIRGTGQA
nr:hypothetical protein [Tanacetum cinerariifolium]